MTTELRSLLPAMYVYMTDHIHSRVVCAAVAAGCNGKIVPPPRLFDGPAVVYGILRGCGEIIKQCRWVGRDFYHIDLGYFRRGHYEGYYRLSKNGLQATAEIFPIHLSLEPDRWESLGMELKPWKKSGRSIIVCPLTEAMGGFLGIDPQAWTNTVVNELQQFTDRPIQVKLKNQGSLNPLLKEAWCLVTHSSNAAIDALVEGVPTIVLGESIAKPVSWAFADLEAPRWPERLPWAWGVAYRQFTLDEM